jgi:uncharacterized Zn-finger protein
MAKKKKKKSVPRKKSQSVFYVGLRDSGEVRRNLLEGAREAIRFLQRFENLKSIREEKLQTILQLDAEVKELRTLVNHLRKSFPTAKPHLNMPNHKPKCSTCGSLFSSRSSLTKHMKVHRQPKPVPKPPELPKPARNRPMSDLEKLEGELTDIEGKLGELE